MADKKLSDLAAASSVADSDLILVASGGVSLKATRAQVAALAAGSVAASKLVGTDIVLAESQVTGLTADLAAKAPLVSPALAGTPTAPTAAPGTNTTQVATTAFVLANGGGGGGGPITSVFGRTGTVVATTGDYTAAQVTSAASTAGSYADPAWVTSLAGSKVTGAIGGNAGGVTGGITALLPSQSGQAGKQLQTNGTSVLWAAAPAGTLPSQTGHSGQWLGTNGTNASWGVPPGSQPTWINVLAPGNGLTPALGAGLVAFTVTDGSPTTTSCVGDSSLSSADDTYVGKTVFFGAVGDLGYDPPVVTAYDGATRRLTWSPATPAAPTNGSGAYLITDDYAAVQTIINFYPGHTFYLPCTSTDPWAGGYLHASYYFSNTLVLDEHGTTVQGEGIATPLQFRRKASGLHLKAGSCGAHDLTVHGMAPWLGSNLAGFEQGVIPAGRAVGVTTSRGADDADGVRVGAAGCFVSNVGVAYFGRDGVNASGTDLDLGSGVGFEVGKLLLCNTSNCRGNGITVAGGDSNVSIIELANGLTNQGWSVYMAPFLGGSVRNAQADANHFDSCPLSPAWSPSAYDSITRTSNVARLVWGYDLSLVSWGTGSGVPTSGTTLIITGIDNGGLLRVRIFDATGTQIVNADETAYPGQSAAIATLKAQIPGLLPSHVLTNPERAQVVGEVANITGLHLTWSVPMTTPVFAVGDVAQVITNPDPTLVGRWRVLSVAADNRSLTFTSVGANTTTTGGTAIWNLMPQEVTPTSITRAATAADVTTTVTLTSGSPVVTMASTAGLVVGMNCVRPGDNAESVYFPADTLILSVDSGTQVTMRKNAKLTGSASVKFWFPWSPLKTTTVVLPASYSYNSVGLKIGHGVDAQNNSDASYNGIKILLSVSTDGKTLAYAESGTAGSLTGPNVGTLRLAAPSDVWAAAGFKGGCFKSAGGETSYVTWDSCYAEGAQPWEVGIGDYVIQPTKSDPITGGGLVLYSSASGIQQPAFSRLVGIVTEDDAGVTASELVGKTQARPVSLYYRDPTVGTGATLSCLWKMAHDAHTWSIYTGDNDVNAAALPLIQLNRDAGPSFFNTPAGWNMAFQYFANSGDGIIVGNGSGNGVFTRISGGNITPAPIHEAAATNGSLFLNLDQLDGAGKPKFSRKDNAGAVTVVEGGGTPGGSSGQIQVNVSGAFAGDSKLLWDATNHTMGVGGAAQAPSGGTTIGNRTLTVYGECDSVTRGPLVVKGVAGGDAYGVSMTLDATPVGGNVWSFEANGTNASAGPGLFGFFVTDGVTFSNYAGLFDRYGQVIFGVNQFSPLGQVAAYCHADSTKGFVARRNSSSASGNLFEGQNESGAAVFAVSAAGVVTTGAWNGTKVNLAYGGTNADLSATGGAGQYLKQSTSGAAVTVGTIPAGDVPDLSATYATRANNLSDLASAAAARTNLGLGSAATHASTDYTPALAPTAVKTANYSAAAGDLVPADVSGGSLTVTLPAAPANGSLVAVKMVVASGSNAVTISAGGSDVFNKAGGSTSLTLTLLNQAVLLQYKSAGALWYVLADDLTLSSLDARFSPLAGSSGLTATGTITSGTWNGTTLDVAHGGTGATTAPAARTGLGLDTMATQAAGAVAITGGTLTGVTLVSHGGSRATSNSGAFDLSTADWFVRTLDGTNGTPTVSNEQTNQQFTVELIQDATGSRAVSWASFGTITWMTSGGAAPTTTLAANLRVILSFKRISAGAFLGFLAASQA